MTKPTCLNCYHAVRPTAAIPCNDCCQNSEFIHMAEYHALRFANFCYEYGILEPVHQDYMKFLDQGAEYYDEMVKQAQIEYNNDTKKQRK